MVCINMLPVAKPRAGPLQLVGLGPRARLLLAPLAPGDWPNLAEFGPLARLEGPLRMCIGVTIVRGQEGMYLYWIR